MTDRERQVYLVDDDAGIRRGVSFSLRTSGYIVKTFASGVEFLDAASGLPAGCVLLDIRMPEMDGLEVQHALRAKGVLMPVVMMTGHGDVDLAVRAMKGGAVDFIEKPFERSVLVGAVESAFVRLERAGRRHARAEEARARLAGLTPREMDVMKGLAQGYPNKTIAYDLGISSRTVEIHRSNMMRKLGVPSLSEALRIGFAAGLGNSEEDEAED